MADAIIKKSLTKDNVYNKEQTETLNKIITILGLVPDDKTSCITKNALESIYDEINQLYDNFKIYYSTKITSNIDKTQNKAISIIRTILKHHGYKLNYKFTKLASGATMPKYFITKI